MRLTLRLLGAEVLHVEIGRGADQVPDRPRLEATGGGLFEMGFQPAPSWSPVERDAEGP